MSQTLHGFLTRPLIALSLAAGLALSPFASAPARAHDDELAAFVAALGAMIVIGAIITDDDRHRGRIYTQQGFWYAPRALPESCLKSYRTRDGYEAYFSERCLRNKYSSWRSLPGRCELTLRVYDEWGNSRRIDVYKPRCLRRAGYFIARASADPDFQYGR